MSEMSSLTPEGIMKLSGAYWFSRALLTGVELSVFETIGHSDKTAAEISKDVGASKRGMELLLNALAALGLLCKDNGRYSNSEVSANTLLPNGSAYCGNMLRLHAGFWHEWGQLTDAVRNGKPVQEEDVFHASDEQIEQFTLAMRDRERTSAPALSEQVDLSDCRTLLDLGGGPGIYSVFFCRANPGLKATLLDLPTTLKASEKILSDYPERNRIRLVPCDFLKERIEGPFDVVFASHIIHAFGEAENRELMKNIHQATAPGGRLIIQDFVLDENRAGPMFAAIFALNMLIATDDGRTYSEGEIRSIMEEAGFGEIGVTEITVSDVHGQMDSRLISGVKLG